MVLSMAFGIHPAPVLAADEFPTRPISLIVPYPPGGATDNLARMLAKKISENIGKPVIVENKPGATGMIAGEFLSRATPDGHTIMMDQSSIVANPSLYSSVRFDVRKDLAPMPNSYATSASSRTESRTLASGATHDIDVS